MRSAGLITLLLAVGCATPAPAAFVHPEFAARRPATLALETEGPASVRREVGEAVYHALIALNYAVLAPGEPPGPGMGVARVVVTAVAPEIAADLSILDAEGTRVFRAGGTAGTPAKLAERLVGDLPAK